MDIIVVRLIVMRQFFVRPTAVRPIVIRPFVKLPKMSAFSGKKEGNASKVATTFQKVFENSEYIL
jgi:hypothetical protein